MLYFLPKAVLAATIVVAVINLVDFKTITLARRYRAADFWAIVITITVTLLAGVELGVLAVLGRRWVCIFTQPDPTLRWSVRCQALSTIEMSIGTTL